MRFRNDGWAIAALLAALGLTAGCAGGAPVAPAKPYANETAALDSLGPAGDYPVVLGEPFTVDGIEYVPRDALNYDEVGYATRDEGEGYSAAHRTLPLPSYVEITSLENGKTIVVRVERRGPMTSRRLVALSAQAMAALGLGEGGPVRVRRVNPPEFERAALRAGRAAPPRMDTPMTLVAALKRRLPAEGSRSLARKDLVSGQGDAKIEDASEGAAPTLAAAAPAQAEPVAPSSESPQGAAVNAPPSSQTIAGQEPATAPEKDQRGGFVVRVASFASTANAEAAAKAIAGHVKKVGRYHRLVLGPYVSRGQAREALAKAKAQGYSDAYIARAE